MKKKFQTFGLGFIVSIYNHFDGKIGYFKNYHFDDVKSTAKFVSQFRKDSHNLGYVRTDDLEYNSIVNEAFCNTSIAISRYFRDENKVFHHYLHCYEVYRPLIFIDDDNNFEDLMKAK